MHGQQNIKRYIFSTSWNRSSAFDIKCTKWVLKLRNVFLLLNFIFHGRGKYNMTFHQYAKNRGG